MAPKKDSDSKKIKDLQKMLDETQKMIDDDHVEIGERLKYLEGEVEYLRKLFQKMDKDGTFHRHSK